MVYTMLRKHGLDKYFVPLRRLFHREVVPTSEKQRLLNLEVLEQRLLLSCDTDFTSGVLTITCDGDDDVVKVAIAADGALLLNDVAITGDPTTSNTDSIHIIAGDGDDQIIVDQTSGALGPGATSEVSGQSEIEVTVEAGGGTDSLTLHGQDADADTS